MLALETELAQLAAAFPIEFAELRASPKQLQFQQAFAQRHDDAGRTCDVFVALGGNRSGKSYVAGWLCFAKHLRDVARDGSWYWCVGQNLDRSINGQQRELWKALPRWMFGGSDRGVHAWDGLPQVWSEKIGFGGHRKILLATHDGGKCLVEFRSADQDPSTFEQAKLDGVWCDERLPEAIYDRLLARIIDRSAFILYSDIPEQWWQHERLINAKADAGVFFQHFRMADNQHNLPDDAIARASAKMTPDERRQRIEGEMVVLEGVVYREYDDVRDSVEPFEIPLDWPRWRVIDYGASAPTACAWVTISPNETAYVYREYYQANLSVEKNAAAIVAMSEGETYRTTYIDPHAFDPPPVYYGAARTIAQQYQAAGVRAQPWPFVNVMGEHAMVQRVKGRLENGRLRVFKTCTDLRREFRSWKYKVDKDGKPLAVDAFENGNNHLLDCLKGFFGTSPCFTGGGGIKVEGEAGRQQMESRPRPVGARIRFV